MNEEVKKKGAGADLGARTKDYALRIVRLYEALPSTGAGQVMGKQLLRSGTSVGAQYREARRARSTAEFVAKLGAATQEIDESAYWLELLSHAQGLPARRLLALRQETEELLAIFISSIKTANRNRAGTTNLE